MHSETRQVSHLRFTINYHIHNAKEALARKIAWALPRRVVYWAAIRLCSAATVGKYEDVSPTSLTVPEALQRWERDDRDIVLEPEHVLEIEQETGFFFLYLYDHGVRSMTMDDGRSYKLELAT